MAKLWIVAVLCVSCLSFSCSQKPPVPYMVEIPREEMKALLIEMHMLDASVKTYIMYNKVVFVKKQAYETIFKRHHVTERQFIWNIINYTKKKDFDGIYDAAISELTERKADIERRMISNAPVK